MWKSRFLSLCVCGCVVCVCVCVGGGVRQSHGGFICDGNDRGQI